MLKPVLKSLVLGTILSFSSTASYALCGAGVASEPLTSACLLRAFDAERAAARRAPLGRAAAIQLYRRGFVREIGFDPSIPWRPLVSRRVAPVLRWDRNVTGGNPDRPIILNGLPFTFEPDSVARAGLLVGGRGGIDRRSRVAEGTVLDLFADVSAAHAPAADANVGTVTLGGCLRHARGIDGTTIDLCSDAAYTYRRRSEGASWLNSVQVQRAFAVAGRDTALSLRIAHLTTNDYEQPQATVGYEAILSPLTTARLAATFAPPEGDDLVLRSRIAGRVTRVAGRRIYAIDGSWAKEGGSRIFGMSREDEVARVGLTIGPIRRLDLRVGYTRRRSTIGTFDETFPTIAVSARPIRF